MRRRAARPEQDQAPATAAPGESAVAGAPAQILVLQRGAGNRAVAGLLARDPETATAPPPDARELEPLDDARAPVQKDASARFGGDPTLEKVAAGTTTLKKGATGLAVTKLQQALVDLGYKVAKVSGRFDDSTETALKKLQSDEKIPQSGELDAATIGKLNARYDTRKAYVDNATFDPAHPGAGTRKLSADDRAAALAAMVPQRGVGGAPATFQDEVAGKLYGPEIAARLTTLITNAHKRLFEDKKPLRADPAKNLHSWAALESAAEAAKDVTDALYKSYNTGPPIKAASGNLIDQWEDELAANAALKPAEKETKAVGKVWYLINANCADISDAHSAVPSDTKEKAILTPIVTSFTDTAAKVQTLLDIDVGWPGAQLEGTIYLQRFKQQGKDKAETDEKNRFQLWKLFHTCIHEYIHALADPKYRTWARSFKSAGDETRYNTLMEGMDEFFTLTVRKTVSITDALRKKVEGAYYDVAATVPDVKPSVYPSVAQAEQVVSIVGVRNASSAYFRGEVELMGKK